ncbi:MAG: ammonium transporter [Microcystaceae cyanobacterium]
MPNLRRYLITGTSLTAIAWLIGIAPTLAETEIQQQIVNAQTSADTAFMSSCTSLVLFMTVGLAFFYGGFVAKKNVLNTLMMSFVSLGIVGIAWLLWGYSLAFAPGTPFIGGLQWLFLNGVGMETTGYLEGSAPETMLSYAPTIPHQAFMIYQAMFAVITPALISGAIVERTKFKAYCLFLLLWLTFVYCPMAHMVWAKGGFMSPTGILKTLDFAGGSVVHLASGVSALVAAIFIGPRNIYPNRLVPPHNVPFILLGSGLLWYGWFGFNAGSALTAGTISTTAFIATNTSAAAAMLTWLVIEQIVRGKPSTVGAATGVVVGLVAVTPSAGFVTPMSAIGIGIIASIACFFAISLKIQLRIDDSLDTFPVHGVGGAIGSILTGVFASQAVNSGGLNGLIAGNPFQLIVQIIGVVLTILFSGVMTFILLQIVNFTVGLRLKQGEELQGMDITAHGEEGYGQELT